MRLFIKMIIFLCLGFFIIHSYTYRCLPNCMRGNSPHFLIIENAKFLEGFKIDEKELDISGCNCHYWEEIVEVNSTSDNVKIFLTKLNDSNATGIYEYRLSYFNLDSIKLIDKDITQLEIFRKKQHLRAMLNNIHYRIIQFIYNPFIQLLLVIIILSLFFKKKKSNTTE